MKIKKKSDLIFKFLGHLYSLKAFLKIISPSIS